MIQTARVTILVKALPRPSKKFGETVCCAGIDDGRSWRRLYPVRFRQLSDDQSFARWDVVQYRFTNPPSDHRIESCHVYEDSINVVGKVKSLGEKQDMISKCLVGSEREAMENGHSLAIIRPTDVRFKARKRSLAEVAAIKDAYQRQARQTSFLDIELAKIEPISQDFSLSFTDADGKKTKRCADWETEAAFLNFRRLYGEERAINELRTIYTEQYVESGLVLGLGNIAARPKTWQLLAIFPVPLGNQGQLF